MEVLTLDSLGQWVSGKDRNIHLQVLLNALYVVLILKKDYSESVYMIDGIISPILFSKH